MSRVVFFNSYRLKKGVSVPAFLVAVENLHKAYIAKQKGFVSFKLLADGETWADATTFQTMADAKSFAESGTPNDWAETFYSFLDFDSCQSHFFSVEQES